MTYRDDRDADMARIEALEHELGSANKKIADLERAKVKAERERAKAEREREQLAERAKRERAPSPAQGTQLVRKRSAGALVPSPEVEERGGVRRWTYTFPYELRADRCRDVMETIAQLAGPANGTLDLEGPRLMTWRGHGRSIELVVANGRTQLTCSDRIARNRTLTGIGITVIGGLAMIKAAASPLMIAACGAGVLILLSVLAVAASSPSAENVEMFDRAAMLIAQASD